MKLWIVLYHHRHGVDAWPRFSDARPDPEREAAGVDFEEDRDESIEVIGPFDPANTAEIPEAHT